MQPAKTATSERISATSELDLDLGHQFSHIHACFLFETQEAAYHSFQHELSDEDLESMGIDIVFTIRND